MRDRVKVLLLGTGQMGAGIARLLLNKQGLQLGGAPWIRLGNGNRSGS